jgi:hypothetical protein
VGSNKTITYAFTGIGTCTNRGIHGTCLTANQDRHITTTNKLTADQANFGSLGHGISSLDGGNKTTGFDHS